MLDYTTFRDYAGGVKRLLSALALLPLAASVVLAQIIIMGTVVMGQSQSAGGPIFNVVSLTADPSPCSATQVWYNTTSALYKICPGGVAAQIGTGGGSGTVNTGVTGHLAYYGSSAAAVSDLGADFIFNTHTLTGGASAILDLSAGSSLVPTAASTDSSTKSASTAYVTNGIANAIAAVNPAVAVQAASAAVLPNSPIYNNGVAGIGATLTTATTNVALVVDGYTPLLSDRVLVKNQASAFQNGVYTVTQLSGVGLAWILTRALDADAPSDMNNTGAIPVVNGTANIGTQWLQTSKVTTVGTDAVTFTQFSVNLTSAGAGTVFSNNSSATGAPGYNTSLNILGPRPWIDVVAYGADPTGAADSATAINNAITACPAAGGLVIFPSGTYIHNSQILLNQNNCILWAFNRNATLRKNYNSTGGFPGASGSILISGSNTGIVGLIYDGNSSGGKTGPCITDATTNTDILFWNDKIFNCDTGTIMLTGPSAGTAGPSRVKILDNYIVAGANANGNQGVIGILETVSQVLIRGNTLDCSLDTNTAGVGCIQAESQGLTTILSGITIDTNYITASIPPSNTGWSIQIGPFNAYALADVIITNNTMEVLASGGPGGGCVSAEFIPGLVLSNNTCNFNGASMNYTAFEVFADKATITNNTCNTENPGQADCFNFIALNSSSVIGNVINGFGEDGSGGNLAAGIIIGGTHANQSISTLASAASGSGSIVTVTATGTCSSVNLCPWFQPGVTVTITGATTAGYNISGTILNSAYVRTTGTFTMYNPTANGSLGACSGACTTSAKINAQQNNNVIADNTITLACGGTLASNRYGILVRPQGTGELANNNKIHNNIIIGCGNGAAGDYGISLGGAGTVDSTDVTNNKLINLVNGINRANGTNSRFLDNTFVGVTNNFSGSAQAGEYIRFAPPTTAPSCAFTSGGGTSPSCAIDTGSTNDRGIIIATTGTGAPGTTGTITLTFGANFGINKPVCTYAASDNVTAWGNGPVFKDKTPAIASDLFTWTNIASGTPTALATSSAYWINYQCVGK